ncbi:MAG: 2-amino-4-hydroxy-6-hydroxymethyldihydropteridine diphosphokinase [Candidatus Edwardsbacteria bacterium]|nr:2-amino-4-hydroxy-6-hydroxymethyldihydropteridine diphosphokinase [Candidatus Edwardsbacteria bacterium]
MSGAARHIRHRAFIGLGSNLGNRLGNLRGAISAIREMPGLTIAATSSVYETAPVGNRDQPKFINAVIEVGCELSPQELLAALLRIEKHMGREPRGKWEPRVIDLDIIYYGDQVLNTTELTVPHPEAARRAFVLEPLSEIAPDFVDPVEKKTVLQLLSQLDRIGQAVAKIAGSKY